MDDTEEKQSNELIEALNRQTEVLARNIDSKELLAKKEDESTKAIRAEHLRVNAMNCTISLYRKLAESSIDIDKVIADADKVFKYFINGKS